MKIRSVVILFASLGLIATAIAGEERRTQMVVAVASDEAGETRIELDGDSIGFDLHDMQVGENRSVVDKNGQPVLITREPDGFRLEFNGESVTIPEFDGASHGEMHKAIAINGESDIDVRVIHGGHGEPMHAPGDVVILSGKPIDSATQQAIQSLLESAGHSSDVHFIDHDSAGASAGNGPHSVKVIKKRVEIEQ